MLRIAVVGAGVHSAGNHGASLRAYRDEHPGEVRIDENVSGTNVEFMVRVAQEDLGRVIGKKGRTAKSLRLVMSAAAVRRRKRVAVEFAE